MRRTLTELRLERELSLRGVKAIPTPAQVAILSECFGVGLHDWRFVPEVEVTDG